MWKKCETSGKKIKCLPPAYWQTGLIRGFLQQKHHRSVNAPNSLSSVIYESLNGSDAIAVRKGVLKDEGLQCLKD